MPRVATDYSKTVIYCFVCQDKTITCSYVGSTTDIVKRKCCHKSRCHNQTDKRYNYSLYQTIRDNGGWTNWTMMPLEEYPCENSIQQRIREQYWIDKLKPELNCNVAYHTEETLKEKRKQKDANYYAIHKDSDEYKAKQKKSYSKYYETHKGTVEYNAKQAERQQAYRQRKALKSKIIVDGSPCQPIYPS